MSQVYYYQTKIDDENGLPLNCDNSQVFTHPPDGIIEQLFGEEMTHNEPTPMQFFDALVDWAIGEMKLIEARAVANREQRKIRRNAAARKRYARQKASGKLQPKTAPAPDYDYVLDSCACAATNHPPCSWCENQGE